MAGIVTADVVILGTSVLCEAEGPAVISHKQVLRCAQDDNFVVVHLTSPQAIHDDGLVGDPGVCGDLSNSVITVLINSFASVRDFITSSISSAGRFGKRL